MECKEIVEMAINNGYRWIDTASVYRNEQQVGEAIGNVLKSIPRNQLRITTKLGPKQQGKQALKGIQDALDKIGLDYIDCILIHWPGSQGLKPNDPQNAINRQETLLALEEAKQKGLVKEIGVSNYTLGHLCDIASRIDVHQFEFHPLVYTQEMREMISFCKQHNIRMEAYSSFGEGRLVDGSFDIQEIDQVAMEAGCTKPQVLLKWAINHGFHVIPKSCNSSRQVENLQAINVQLTDKHMQLLDSITERFGERKFCWDPRQIL